MSKIAVDIRRLSPRKKHAASIFLSKGRSRKARSQSRDARSLDRIRSPPVPQERPSTRRNPSVCPVPITRANSQPDAKPRTAQCESPRPSTSDQHKYLQFSLRITEEIIHKDLYDNHDMLQIVRKHYDANKDACDKEKLLAAIVDLCHELGIPWSERALSPAQDKPEEAPPAPYQIYECGCTMVQSVSSTTPFLLTMVETGIATPEGGDAARLEKPVEASAGEQGNAAAGDDADVHVLHDATATFACDGDSDLSSLVAAQAAEARPNPLVVTHYATSVEPARVETQDLSVQTMESATQVSDAATQKSLTACSATSHATTQSGGAQRCQHCQCSCEPQPYVFLDGPVLIPHDSPLPAQTSCSVGYVPRASFTLPSVALLPPTPLPPPPMFGGGEALPETPAAPASSDNLLLGAAERYQRYKKVTDNLSAFYPTIATQVSSMELVPHRGKPNPTSADATTMFSGARLPLRQKDLAALDKYRIDNQSSRSLSLTSHASGSKRHYPEELVPDREHSHSRIADPRPDDGGHRRERASVRHFDDASMDRRLSQLRQGIENRGRDEVLDTTQFLVAQQDPNRHGEILNVLQRGPNAMLSYIGSPKHKKLTVFKK